MFSSFSFNILQLNCCFNFAFVLPACFRFQSTSATHLLRFSGSLSVSLSLSLTLHLLFCFFGFLFCSAKRFSLSFPLLISVSVLRCLQLSLSSQLLFLFLSHFPLTFLASASSLNSCPPNNFKGRGTVIY